MAENKAPKELIELAWKECLGVWRACAVTGFTKKKAIEWAYEKGWVNKPKYKYECPFCEYLRMDYTYETVMIEDGYAHRKTECDICIWPKDRGNLYTRCTRNESFWKWGEAVNVLKLPPNVVKQYASTVYKFIKEIGDTL